jgi:secretion/DNA translocation related CpaE-like protein
VTFCVVPPIGRLDGMTPVATPAPLIATADEQLADDALRWCAAVGAPPDRAADVASVRRSWRTAPAVLVGDDLVDEIVRASLPRREHVVVIAREPSRWWADAVSIGAVAVCSPHDEHEVVELLSAALDGSGEACVVSVVGGSGGAGASTLVAALGVEASGRGVRSLVVDADPWGGGLELLLGAEGADGVRWDDFGSTRGRLDAASLVDVLPSHAGVRTLAWGRGSQRRVPDSWTEVVSAAVRGFDLVAVDVPRHLGPAGAELVGRSVLTLVVVPEEIAAVAAARRVIADVSACAPSVALVSVARRSGIGAGAVEEALGLPAMARIRPDRRLRAAVDQGRGPGRSRSLRRAAGSVLDAVGVERS